MQSQVYHSHDIQAWEQRWFAQDNSSFGLMQQAAWQISQRLVHLFEKKQIHKVAVCCGIGNNAGDGYLIAMHLKQMGFDVDVYARLAERTLSYRQAKAQAEQSGVQIFQHFDFQQSYDVYIDALFGIGLNRELDADWQDVIRRINQQKALKVAIDIPSGLHADTGQLMPDAIKADYTYSILGYKLGLFTGQGKAYAGQIELISILPPDQDLKPMAYCCNTQVLLPSRVATGHKGSYGHVLVIGGHADMGGAVIMSAEAAFAAGAGKVTIICHRHHHAAILARSPNIMIKDIEHMNSKQRQQLVSEVDAICFGMGLGRDEWAEQRYQEWMALLQSSGAHVVMDADALWFLAKSPQVVSDQTYLTPHPGEAATLLGVSTSIIESNRADAIFKLKHTFAGQWALKGAGSLILESHENNDTLYVCTAGNAGMATGGMGDVLSGMIASLKAQFSNIALHDIVTLHAVAGDLLAEKGQRGMQAHHMPLAIQTMVNHAE